MSFHPNRLYHIYNQGNNRRIIFFSDENYRYFLWKMRTYLLPFGDIVAYCLMPNHYHWLFFVKAVEIKRAIYRAHVDKTEYQRRKHKYGEKAFPVELQADREADDEAFVSLNEAVGTIQKTYTQAINKEHGFSGSLFRKPFKYKDGWINEFISERKKDGKPDYRFQLGNDYAFQCLEYIHANPTKKLVNLDTDWAYSSAKDYADMRKGTLCNIEMGRNILEYL